MNDTNTAEREAFEAHCLRTGLSEMGLRKWGETDDVPPRMRGDYIMRIVQNAWLAFQAGRASLAASAGSEPVAWTDGEAPPAGTQVYAQTTTAQAAPTADYDHGPQSLTVAEAARHVGKWLNERPNRPLDLRDVAMLCAHAQKAPAAGAVAGPTDAMVLAALQIQYPAAYGKLLRHPANGPKTAERTEDEIDTARRMIAAALAAAPTPAAQAADSVPQKETPDETLWQWYLANKGVEIPHSRAIALRVLQGAIRVFGNADSVLEDAARLEALHAAVTAIYLDDSSDFKSALGAVVRHLDPKLAGDLLAWPKRAFDISKSRLDAARKQGGTHEQQR